MSSRAVDEARVLVLYTGGTIGMLSGEDGYVPHPGFLESSLRANQRFHDPERSSLVSNSDSIDKFREWKESASGSSTPALTDAESIEVRTATGSVSLPSLVTPRAAQGKRIRYAILEFDVLIDSSEVEPKDWIEIASAIERNYTLCDAFVVLHGTDTMAYSASAISFALEGLGKTVIFTGAQIPICELSNDAVDNLLYSLIIAGHFLIPEVCLFFNHRLMRGNRCVKFASNEFAAFDSFNLAPLANVGTDIRVNWSAVLRPGPRKFRVHKILSSNVATLRIFPGISSRLVHAFFSSDVQGIVLETYGAGNAPRREELLSAFREATERGVVIVNVTQCARGAVSPDIYETGRALRRAGITSGADMTVECALAKLGYLLSKPDMSTAQVRSAMSRSLRGELTPADSFETSSSKIDPPRRFQTLLSSVIKLTTHTHAPNQVVSGAKASSGVNSAGSDEFASDSDWPSSSRNADAAEKALTPYLLGQAATRADTSLATLIASLASSPSDSDDAPVISQLSDPCSSSLQTPLHLAILSSRLPNVLLLLEHGASVHARDIQCHTPLFYAARLGAKIGVEMVEALCSVGAHLGETEVMRGDVGLEILKAEKIKSRDVEAWQLAAGDDLARARAVLLALLQ